MLSLWQMNMAREETQVHYQKLGLANQRSYIFMLAPAQVIWHMDLGAHRILRMHLSMGMCGEMRLARTVLHIC